MSRNILSCIMLVLAFVVSHRAVALEITEATHENYQAYLKQIGATKHGAFAVSPDGLYSWYIYCTDAHCIQTGIGQEALAKCQTLAGQKCQLLATDRTVRIEFTVAADRTELSPEDEILKSIVNAEQLKQLTVGNTMEGEYPNSKKWMEYYDPSGEIRGKDGKGEYSAKYELKGDQICFDYDGTDDDWCAQISMRGNKVDFLEDGKLVSFIRNTVIIPGNPSGL